MSEEGAKAFYERVTSDEQFRAQLQGTTWEESQRIAAGAGYDVSPDDLPTIRNLAGRRELSDEDLHRRELPDEELQRVSAGDTTEYFWQWRGDFDSGGHGDFQPTDTS
jgi:predicted ribosomally synthesized peptide with nif11-like leader